MELVVKAESLHEKIDAIVMSALHSVAQAQLGPACRSDHKEDNHLAANVTGNEAGQKKQASKHARKQTCQNRQEKQTGISFQNGPETQLGKNGGKRNMNLNQSDVVSLCHACHAKRRWM